MALHSSEKTEVERDVEKDLKKAEKTEVEREVKKDLKKFGREEELEIRQDVRKIEKKEEHTFQGDIKKLEKRLLFDKLKRMKKRHQLLFAILISFAIIQFWRGVWGITDYVFIQLFPEHELASYFVSIALGIFFLAASGYLIAELNDF